MNKKGNSSNTNATVKTKDTKERVSPRTGKPVRRYVKRTETGNISDIKPAEVQEKEIKTDDSRSKTESKTTAPIIEKTSKGNKIIIDEKELLRLQHIEKITREFIIGADKINKYVGYGKSPSIPDNHEAQEGNGVKQLRKLLDLEPKKNGEPGSDVPF